MSDADDWSFGPQGLDLDGDMTLVLAKRSGKKLVGGKIEFANDATEELREMVKRSAARVSTLTRRTYEPSLRITDGEYLAVPDQLIEKAAPPLPPPAKTAPSSDGGSSTAQPPATPKPAQHIETDPQVRALLRNASGLPLLAAQALGKQPFQFYAVVVGNDPATRTSFVRKVNPTKSLDVGKLWFSFGERLTKVEQPLLSLDDHFDLIVTTEGIAVLNQGVFDSLFRDAETLVQRYPVWAQAFSTLGLGTDQTDVLVERCRRDSRLAERLRQIHESGHLAAGHVTLEQVLNEADRVAGGRTRFLSDGRLDFSGQDVTTLLKLLNDDLFIGGLSHLPYEAGSKARYKQSAAG
jgi:hypothetical protein